jgi:hypothetical protein
MPDSSDPHTSQLKAGAESCSEKIPFLTVGIFFLVILAFSAWHRFN